MRKLIALSLVSSALLAQVFHVSTTPQLRQALRDAATNGEADTIILAFGIYKTTNDGRGTFVYFSNEEHNLTIRGQSANTTILSGDNIHRILKHKSTVQKTFLILENLTFKDGNACSEDIDNCTNWGGGVLSWHYLVVKNCNFINNKAYRGGGFKADSASIISNSLFKNNFAKNEGGGFFIGNFDHFFPGKPRKDPEIINSTFQNNKAARGGGFHADNIKVSNCLFQNNYAKLTGGGFHSNNDVEITNSMFIKNSVNSNNEYSNLSHGCGHGYCIILGYGGGFYAGSAKISGSLFKNNFAEYEGGGFYTGGVTIFNSIIIENNADEGGSGFSTNGIAATNILLKGNRKSAIKTGGGVIYNSVFLQNEGYDIAIKGNAILEHLDNNYIDISKVQGDYFAKNNIFGTPLGFVDEAKGDFNLTADSSLIDAGTTNTPRIQLPSTDINGNARIVGASIDIGPCEFSTTKPTILDVRVEGELIEDKEVHFDVEYRLYEGRHIQSILFDYENDGSYVPQATHVFDKPGKYKITIKVIDDTGEFSTKTIEITIKKADLKSKLSRYLTEDQISQIMPLIQEEIAYSLQNALPIHTPHTDTAALLQQLEGKELRINGYYIHYDKGTFDWIYIPASLRRAYKLERGIRKDYGLVWTLFPKSTVIEKRGESIILHSSN